LADGTEIVCLADSDSNAAHKVVGANVCVRWGANQGYLLDGWPEVGGSTATNVDQVEAAL
jgi:hypothetical protein